MNNLRYYSISNANVITFLRSHFLSQVRLLSVTSVTSVTSLGIWWNRQEVYFFFQSSSIWLFEGWDFVLQYMWNVLYQQSVLLAVFYTVVFLLLKAVRITLNHATHSSKGTLTATLALPSTGICSVVVITFCTLFIYNEIFLSSLWLKPTWERIIGETGAFLMAMTYLF